MKCCSKAGVALAVVAGLGIAGIAATGVGPAMWNRVVRKFEKQVPPEVQVEQLKIDISKLDKDIDKNWGPIATYEREIKELRVDLDKKSAKIKTMEKELAASADELEAAMAAKDGKAKNQVVFYQGKEYKLNQAANVLSREKDFFVALKREVASKEKLLGAREQKLNAAMASQKEMMSQKEELKTQVAQLEADLEVLKLRRTEAKLPTEKVNRLDRIKVRINKLKTDVSDQTRAEELRESFSNNGAATSEAREKIELNNDNVVKSIREALGNHNVAKDGN